MKKMKKIVIKKLLSFFEKKLDFMTIIYKIILSARQ